ncbi:Mpv17 / PMP22 family [Seminavis robusta]|uniref:Mpv17 / PMP22 family n=1 Tax=Seminavis robusta TaxID=568900 RepID=A0A9N8EK72_9STRA|nr:Mpv17 / PMP22 family [Seminavis robusta]|eukprot:Sro1095_g240720.1 Mpv17 / PMP22 family (2464) ;mRNA; r:27799-35190
MDREDKFQALNRLVTQQQAQQPQPTQQQQPSTGGNDRQLYSPTPKELAYALHIMENSFASSLQLYNQTQHAQISITGQDAVAFLTTSGIHRLILRILWTVVDPNNTGTLVDLAQFHTIIRLVALTQAGHVEPELLAVGTMPPPKPTPVQVIWSILNKTRGTMVPLAKFDAIQMPSQQVLQQLYMIHQRQAQAAGRTVAVAPPQRPHSVSPVPNNWPQQQPPQQQPQGMASFDALAGGSLDQPLPSLGTTTAETAAQPAISFPVAAATASSIKSAAASAFGGFLNRAVGALQPPNTGLPPFQPGNTALGLGPPVKSTGEFDPVDDELSNSANQFGGFQSTTSSSTPAATGMAALDALGSTTDAPLPGLPPPQPLAAAPPVIAALDALGGPMENAPLPSMTATTTAPQQDDFGGFSDATPVTQGLGALDTFGGPTENAPLPSMTATTALQQQQQPASQEEFGGFTASNAASSLPSPRGLAALDTLGPVKNAPLPTLGTVGGGVQQPPPVTVSGGFGGFHETAPAMGLSALDSLGAATDAPLPALGQPTPAAAQEADEFGGFAEAAPQQEEQAAGGFGGFSDASPQQQVMGIAALDSLGAAADAPLPALGQPAPATTQEADEFGGFAEAAPQQGAQGSADGFGGFGEAPPQQQVMGMAAFGSLGAASDAPLPALGQPTPAATQEEDEFGGFAEAVPQQEEQAASSGFGGIGGIAALGTLRGGSTNAPLSSLEQPMPTTPADDEFGGFEDVAKTNTNPLDALGPTQNAPLPQLDGQPALQGVDFGVVSGAPVQEGRFDDEEFGGFSDTTAQPQQQPSSDVGGMAAFDALGGVQDVPLPSPGMGQPQSERVLSNVTPPQLSSIQPSASFPGMGAGGSEMGMSAFDTIGPAQDAPLPSLGASSAATSQATSEDLDLEVEQFVTAGTSGSTSAEDNNEMSFTEEGKPKRRISRSLKRGSSRSLVSPETVPKDLMPNISGEKYVQKVRQSSLRKLPELDLNIDLDELEDPFAGLDPAPGVAVAPMELNESASLGPAAESMPKDLQPHKEGEHYVPHSKHMTETPGGLQTLMEPNHGFEDDDFGDFEEAVPKRRSSVPSQDPASEPNPFATTMPRDLSPHAPGEHYVPHGTNVGKTPGGLSTVGEGSDVSNLGSTSTVPSHLNSQTKLAYPDDPMPNDLRPHMPGEHYVPHAANDKATPGGLATVGEAFGEFVQVQDAPLPRMGAAEEFGDFSGPSSGLQSMMPLPTQLSRQATPAAKDLDHLTKKASAAPMGEMIQEGDEEDEEDDDFGDFKTSESLGLPGGFEIAPPTQMKRQATPRPQDLQDLRPDPPASEKSRPDPPGQSSEAGLGIISESLEEVTSNPVDHFGAFSGASVGIQAMPPPPTQLSRQATPAAKDLEPLTKKASAVPPGSATIHEDDEDDTDFGDFSDATPTAVPTMPMPTQLSRQATPAAKDLDPLTKKGASVGALGGMTIQEGEEEVEEDGDEFTGFEGATMTPGQMDIVPPPQMKRKATPRPQDIKPNLPGTASGSLRQPGLSAIGESQATAEEFESSPASPDPFSAFDSLAAPQAALPVLSLFGAPDEGDAAAAPLDLSRQATPAVQDLQKITRQTHVPSSSAIAEGNEEEDDFGDFGAARPSTISTTPSLDVVALQAQTSLARQTSGDVSIGRLGLRSTTSLLMDESDDDEEEEAQEIRSHRNAGSVSRAEGHSHLNLAERSWSPMANVPDEIGTTKMVENVSGFGDFGFSSSSDVAPSHLSRQATPAVKDLEPYTKKTTAVASPAIVEENDNEDDDEFGNFAAASAGGTVAPPPAQLSRQATPAAKDLAPLTQKASAAPTPGTIVEEGDEEEETDGFGDFVMPGTTQIAPPTQMKRQATPMPQDLRPDFPTPKSETQGLGAIGEDLGETTSDFQASGVLPRPQLSRQATPAVQDLKPLTQKSSPGALASSDVILEEDDAEDFGDFSDGATNPPPPPPAQLSRQATPAAKDLAPLTKKAASGGALEGKAIQEWDEEEGEDEFGDFGDFTGFQEGDKLSDMPVPQKDTPQPQDLSSQELAESKQSQNPNFGSTGEAAEGAITEEANDSFGDFGSFEQAEEPKTVAPKDDIGGFSAFAEAPAPPLADEPTTGTPKDDFGGFSAFAEAPAPPPAEEPKTDSPKGDFGGFSAFAEAPAPPPADEDFGDFGDFSTAAPASSPDPFAATSPSGGAAEWDAFQDAPSSAADVARSSTADDNLRASVVTLSTQLPPAFQKSLDYGKLFDGRIGSPAAMTAENRNRAERAVQVLSLLSGAHKSLASTYWDQSIDVVHNELSLGMRLLEEAASLSSQELQMAKQPVETMVSGMGEYVRATRSIVASIGDMLLLDLSTPFAEATFDSAWGSIPLLKRALDVETLWKGIIDKSASLGLVPTTQLETVMEIRAKCLRRFPSTTVCQLSLQPLSDEDRQTTKASVDWGGKPFMACSANFLANKCPFYQQ